MKLLYSIVLLTLLELVILVRSQLDFANFFFGLPQQAIFENVNKVCSMFLGENKTDSSIKFNPDTMTISLYTPCRNLSVPLSNIEDILESPFFNVRKPTALFVSGWKASPDSADGLIAAFNCRNDHNFLVFNTSDSLKGLYIPSAYNTKEVGRQLALGLEKLQRYVHPKNIYLIGHSLGSHIMGYAGRYFAQYTGSRIGRITGLDPANPCFRDEILLGLQRKDAHFIDIIHSNPGVAGKSAPVGDADFYPDGLKPIKPGCKEVGCSHLRAVEYFAESIYPGNERNFLSVPCASFRKLEKNSCSGTEVPMGFAVPFNSNGTYILTVNENKPYGKNHRDQFKVQSECGKCGGVQRG